MSVFSNAGKALMLSAMSDAVDEIRTHTGDPGADGTDNAGTSTGQTPTFASPSNGAMVLQSAVTFDDGGANEDATWFSIWADSVFMGKGQITSGDTSYNAAGVFRLSTDTKLELTDPS